MIRIILRRIGLHAVEILRSVMTRVTVGATTVVVFTVCPGGHRRRVIHRGMARRTTITRGRCEMVRRFERGRMAAVTPLSCR